MRLRQLAQAVSSAVIGLALASPVCAQPGLANAAPSAPVAAKDAEADAASDVGLKLFDTGQYSAALKEFRRAYELSRSVELRSWALFNMALCKELLERYVEAIELATLSLGVAPQEHAAKKARELIARAEHKVGLVSIESNVMGADVLVDGRKAGTTMGLPIRIDPGDHRVTVRRGGFRSASREIHVQGGGQKDTVTIPLVPEMGRIAVRVDPGEANIYLDDKEMGRGAWDGDALAGLHTVRATAPGREARTEKVLVRDGEPVPLVWRLKESQRGACLGLPRVWCYVGAAGIVLVTGAAVLGYHFGRQRDDDRPQEAPVGSWPSPLRWEFGGRP